MMLKYCVGSCRLAFVILSLSYFLGVLWFLYSFAIYEEDKHEMVEMSREESIETFISTNQLDPFEQSRTNSHTMALLMYFAFTTLSTVGFGDLTPRSDSERLLCIVILFLGVIIFGLILNNFQEIITRFHTLDDDFQDEDCLNMFFDSIKKRYNYGMELESDLKAHIERYFQYRW